MLATLKPQFVWEIFNDICQIPHPSHHEEKIQQYIVDFAKSHNLPYQIDEVGNVLITKEATKGMEKAPSIALQAHMDMVPQKNEDTKHDFFNDPISTYIEGDWVKAKGTTLGADNGVGLASALAVLIDPKVEHGPLEILITTSEETGMVGAFGLQPNWLKSQFLINTDSEEEGEIFTGCAGGADFCSRFPITYAITPEGQDCYIQVSIKGLKGGHSGCDIHLGRGNAIKLMGRFLAEYMKDIPFRLMDIKGGSLRNAIPREAFVEMSINPIHKAKLDGVIQTYQGVMQNEFADTDPNVAITAINIKNDNVKRGISFEYQTQIINWLNSAPNGVVRMSNQFDNIVETSLNLGVLTIEDSEIKAYFLVRSLIDSQKDAVISSLISHSELAKANYDVSGGYSGWQPNLSSQLLQIAQDKYNEIFSIKPKIMVIHAGLECGLFKQFYPQLDMISIGPTIVSPHSPDEKVNIKSVGRYWELLVAILKSAKQLKTSCKE